MNEAYLFNIGKNYQAYNLLGSFPFCKNGREGYSFSVWAPNAKSVSVVGDFNDWDETGFSLSKNADSGIWEGSFEGLRQWQKYKYRVEGADGTFVLKADPFARHSETRPGNASILYDCFDEYEWQDGNWMKNRSNARDDGPLNIYEMHLGSWRRYPDGNTYSYSAIAKQLAEYLVKMGYNAVEFMPLSEYPLDESWGYQVSGYFSVTSRYGTPKQFKSLIDTLHKAGIRVILDWVPAHFPKDAFALAKFDGTKLYEYSDPLKSEHKGWGTLAFDYSKAEVRSFLASSAFIWLDEYHIDGLRVDAVSAMVYLNFGRDEFPRNEYGGLENLEAIDFLKYLNSTISGIYPGVMMIAEESTVFPYVTGKVNEGGLGFTHKWNMGWMNDTLDYMSLDYYARGAHQDKLTFSMTYAFAENYILALSHDEVVHGKHSLLGRMQGDQWRQFSSLRTMLMYQTAHPGAKLNFMGYELGQYMEWRYYEELEWFLLTYPIHESLHRFVADMNHIYLDYKQFWELDHSWEGFEWKQVDDRENAVGAFVRYDRAGGAVLCIMNMTPASFPAYKLGAPYYGKYRVLLNSDDVTYSGSGYAPYLEKGKTVTTGIPNKAEAEAFNKGIENEKKKLSAQKKELEEILCSHKGENKNKISAKSGKVSRRLKSYDKLSPDALKEKINALNVKLNELENQGTAHPFLDIPLPPLCGLFLMYEGESDHEF